MPRSKNPRNYGELYERLTELMTRLPPEIKLQMGRKQAQATRHSFYSFVNACAHEQERVARSKVIKPEMKPQIIEHWAHMEDAGRQYIVFVEDDCIRFVNRDMDPRQQDALAQLNSILSAEPTPSADTLTEALKPRALDGAKVIDKWRELAHDHTPHLEAMPVDPDMTDELAQEILHADPPDKTDLTDLITEDNSPIPHPSPEVPQFFDPLADAEKLRERERAASKESENKS